MAALRQTAQLRQVFRACLVNPRGISSSAVRCTEWDKDWMPGPYPKTEAERVAAAKKYNLLPEDYKPMPDDGSGHGDYPDFPMVGEERKDPYEDWDDPARKRNFGEPLQIHYESLPAEKVDPAKEYSYKPGTMFAIYLTIFTTITLSMIFTLPYSNKTSVYSDWYPYALTGRYIRGKVLPSGDRQIHYTFEPAE